MAFITLKNAEGKLDCMVNLSAIVFATPSSCSEDIITLHTIDGSTLDVDREQFERVLAGQGAPSKELSSKLERLIQALDRMTVHFPTSIRMHL